MATFTPLDANTAVDTRTLVAWREGFTIDLISFTPNTTVELTDVDPGGPSSPDLKLTYTGSTTMSRAERRRGPGALRTSATCSWAPLSGAR